jgi:hypothetical protein
LFTLVFALQGCTEYKDNIGTAFSGFSIYNIFFGFVSRLKRFYINFILPQFSQSKKLTLSGRIL